MPVLQHRSHDSLSLSTSVLGQTDRLGSSVSSASLLRAFFNTFPVSSLSLASGLVLSLSLSKWQAAKQAHNLSLGFHQGMQLWSAKSITEASYHAPSVMTSCGISSAVPSLHPLEVTTSKNASFTLSKSKNYAYPTFHIQVHTQTYIHWLYCILSRFWHHYEQLECESREARGYWGALCVYERDCLN